MNANQTNQTLKFEQRVDAGFQGVEFFDSGETPFFACTDNVVAIIDANGVNFYMDPDFMEACYQNLKPIDNALQAKVLVEQLETLFATLGEEKFIETVRLLCTKMEF